MSVGCIILSSEIPDDPWCEACMSNSVILRHVVNVTHGAMEVVDRFDQTFCRTCGDRHIHETAGGPSP